MPKDADQLDFGFDSELDVDDESIPRLKYSRSELNLKSGETQIGLDFAGNQSGGLEKWKEEQREILLRLRRRHALPFLRKVAVRLHTIQHELTGILYLEEAPKGRRKPLKLSVDNHRFSQNEIESILVIDEDAEEG